MQFSNDLLVLLVEENLQNKDIRFLQRLIDNLDIIKLICVIYLLI